jgi:hypothetical protein
LRRANFQMTIDNDEGISGRYRHSGRPGLPPVSAGLPSWLLTYPGANLTRQNLSAMSAVSFTTTDPPETVLDHYRQLFEENGLPFSPTSNRFANNPRATTDCSELSISIASREFGSAVHVSCSVKLQPRVVKSTDNCEQDVANHDGGASSSRGRGGHRPRASRSARPSPELKWPAWLVEVEGGLPAVRKGADQAGNGMLGAHYVSGSPMPDSVEADPSSGIRRGGLYLLQRASKFSGQPRVRLNQRDVGAEAAPVGDLDEPRKDERRYCFPAVPRSIASAAAVST